MNAVPDNRGGSEGAMNAAPWNRDAVSVSGAANSEFAPDQLSIKVKVFAFAAMCIGFFIALLDIQIVSASLRDIGGGLSAGTDETA